MKTAREVAHANVNLDVCNARFMGVHSGTCDELTEMIAQARRDGAESMRERAALICNDEYFRPVRSFADDYANEIRHLPLEEP